MLLKSDKAVETAKYSGVVILLLVLAVLVLYGQVATHDFINFDDPKYVYANTHVTNGLSLLNLQWSFTTIHAANWHPLTWISHQLDVELFGLNPAGHHLMNVAFHAMNTALLFLLLLRITTGTFWRCATVAALFALHPLHVESVAWVAERKDLLSTFFGLLALHTYVRYVASKRSAWYGATGLCFFASLLAKPMLVTLPCLMLLIDYWPLQRVCGGDRFMRFRRLLLEKLPFFFLAGLSSLVTIYAQQKGKAIASMAAMPIAERLANALISYFKYIFKTIWPSDLAPLYVFPDSIPPWQPLAAALALLAVTILAIIYWKVRPYLMVGWLWYLITLVPVIGLIQVGSQAMADRYTYLPLIGPFIIAAWGINELTAERRSFAVAAFIFSLTTCFVISWRQISLWKDGITLYTHTLSVTEGNWLIQNNLGDTLFRKGRIKEAEKYYLEAIKLNPQFALTYVNFAYFQNSNGNTVGAVSTLRNAVQRVPDDVSLHTNLATYLLMLKQYEEAVRVLNQALAVDQGNAQIHSILGFAYGAQGDTSKAIESFGKALVLNPADTACRYNLAVQLYNATRYEEAFTNFNEVLRQKSDREIETMSLKFLQKISEQSSFKNSFQR